MSKKKITIGVIILIIALGIVLAFLKFHKNDPILSDETDYEEVASKFIYENADAFIEDGYELKLVSQERVDDKNIKMTFFYKLYSYPEGGQFRVDVVVNTENKLVNFIDE